MDLFSCMTAYVKVVEHKSFQQAAHTLSVSPSYVSKQISWLERQLGVKLLQRSPRRLSLTEIGANYYQQCLKVLQEVEYAQGVTTRATGTPFGNLKVNAPVFFGNKHLPKAIVSFNRKYPDVSIDLHLSDEFVDLIEEGYDLGIRISSSLKDSNLIVRELLPDVEARACASTEYLALNGIPQTPKDLLDHNCLISK